MALGSFELYVYMFRTTEKSYQSHIRSVKTNRWAMLLTGPETLAGLEVRIGVRDDAIGASRQVRAESGGGVS
jgi:hypothetical protein